MSFYVGNWHETDMPGWSGEVCFRGCNGSGVQGCQVSC